MAKEGLFSSSEKERASRRPTSQAVQQGSAGDVICIAKESLLGNRFLDMMVVVGAGVGCSWGAHFL